MGKKRKDKVEAPAEILTAPKGEAPPEAPLEAPKKERTPPRSPEQIIADLEGKAARAQARSKAAIEEAGEIRAAQAKKNAEVARQKVIREIGIYAKKEASTLEVLNSVLRDLKIAAGEGSGGPGGPGISIFVEDVLA